MEETKEVLNEEKSLTIDYFSTEVRQQLELYRNLEKKTGDLQKEHERSVERFVEAYKDQDSKIERKPIVDIHVYKMMYQSVVSDMQLTICKIQYLCQIALMAFGFDSFRISKEDKELLKTINNMPSNLFKLHQKKDGGYVVKMKDPDVYEIMTQRAYSQVPEDQKKLRIIWRQYYAEYDQYLKEKEAYEKRVKKEANNGEASDQGQ